MRKRFLILTMVFALSASSFAGCSNVNNTKTVVTVGESTVSEGEINFLARYTQAQYETYYASYFGANMWSQEASDGKNYEETTKDSILENVENMVLLEQHMDEYKVSLSENDQKVIKDTAKAFIDANDADINKKISADTETVERVLTLMAVEAKMMTAIKADADTKVSDKEAAQKAMSYVEFSLEKTDENGTALEMTNDEKAEVKKQAEDFAKKAKADPSKFAKVAEDAGQSPVDITFSADNDSYDEHLIAEADKLKKNEVSGVIEGDNRLFVAVLTSEFDKAATEQQKESIVKERQDDLYQSKLDAWREDAKIDVDDQVWKNIDFNELSVKIKTGEDGASEAETEDTTADGEAESAE